MAREHGRPELHFTAREGWLNDPNGLVCYHETWHLFFQHNPSGCKWGNIHWGHAVSTDLRHWRETGDVLAPDAMGMMYSGSAVVDWENTIGLQTGDAPPICLFYTAAGEHALPPQPYTQCLAYSLDGGTTWQKHAGNPVVPHLAGRNRDPKVVRHAAFGTWIMALYLEEREAGQAFALLRSANLRDWEVFQELYLPGSGECPDLFMLALDGEPGAERWIFWGADGHYLVGSFDGERFAAETEPLMGYAPGSTAYAAQTWNDVPDGRRIQIAWLRGDLPGMPFNQQMSLPVELTLKSTPAGPRLHFSPVRELADVGLAVEFTGPGTVRAAGVPISYRDGALAIGDAPPRPVRNGRLRVVLDRASIEVFADRGAFYYAAVNVTEDRRVAGTGAVRVDM